MFLLVVDVSIIVLSSTFCDSFIFIFIVLVFPFELVAVISTVPCFFAVNSPVILISAILLSLDFHVIFLLVALLGVIVAVNILLSPTSRLPISSLICIFVTSILDDFVFVVVLVVFVPEDKEFDVPLLSDDELDEYGHFPLLCK